MVGQPRAVALWPTASSRGTTVQCHDSWRGVSLLEKKRAQEIRKVGDPPLGKPRPNSLSSRTAAHEWLANREQSRYRSSIFCRLAASQRVETYKEGSPTAAQVFSILEHQRRAGSIQKIGKPRPNSLSSRTAAHCFDGSRCANSLGNCSLTAVRVPKNWRRVEQLKFTNCGLGFVTLSASGGWFCQEIIDKPRHTF